MRPTLWTGTIALILGIALLVIDGARAISLGYFEFTSIERLWATLGGNSLFSLRPNLHDWLGRDADHVIELPTALLLFGLGLAFLLLARRHGRDASENSPTL
jgi:hypothetical protein